MSQPKKSIFVRIDANVVDDLRELSVKSGQAQNLIIQTSLNKFLPILKDVIRGNRPFTEWQG